MARHTENESILRDGAVMIYVRNDVAKPIWQCRIKFPDQPYIRRSLKTRNRGDATAMGELGDEASAATVAGCSVDPRLAIKLSKQLAERGG